MKLEETKKMILVGKDWDLHRFIKNMRKEPCVEEHIKNLKLLKQLDDETISLGIARTEAIDAHYDQAKYLGAYMAILAAFLLTFSRVASSVTVFIITAIIVFGVVIAVVLEKKRRVTAVYLKSLLNQVKNDKQKEDSDKVAQ